MSWYGPTGTRRSLFYRATSARVTGVSSYSSKETVIAVPWYATLRRISRPCKVWSNCFGNDANTRFKICGLFLHCAITPFRKTGNASSYRRVTVLRRIRLYSGIECWMVTATTSGLMIVIQ